MEKLHTKFSALNADFDGSSFDFLGLRKSAQESIKEQYPSKTSVFQRNWPVFRENGCR